MPGYPDSHLTASRFGPKSRAGRFFFVLIPIILVAGWLSYAWFITGVFPVTEKYPSGAMKAQGYVRRAGVEAYKRQGHWVTFHEHGQKESEGDYDRGEKKGDWHYWDEQGRPREARPGSNH